MHKCRIGKRFQCTFGFIFKMRIFSDNKPIVWWVDSLYTLYTFWLMCKGKKERKKVEIFTFDFLDWEKDWWNSGSMFYIRIANQYHPAIKFTTEWTPMSVSFLDTKVYLEEGWLLTDLHVKLTDTHQYLRYDSYHPGHYKWSIPYNQALKVKHICSKLVGYHCRARDLQSKWESH